MSENEAKNEVVGLPVMLASGEVFAVGDKKYKVKPLLLAKVQEFTEENLSIGPQLYNVLNKDARKNLDKWLSSQVTTSDGQPVTVQRAMDDGWSLADLRRCIQKVLDLSG